jgi:VWFA-related protein
VLPTLVLVVAGTVARAQDTGYTADTSIKVDVRLVNLNVTVTDRAAQPYTALKADNFRVYDNGIEQTIHHFTAEDFPYTMGLVLDRSGSMAEMIRDVYRAAFHTVRASKPEDEFFIETFNERNAVQQEFSQDREVLSRALKDIDAYGSTALYDAIWAGLEHVKRGSHDKKVLLVVSDGADNSSTHRFQEVLERARQESVAIYVVGMFDRLMLEFEAQREDTLRVLLTQLAEATGGRAYFPKTVKQCEQACIAIAQELRQQYAIGFYPSHNMRDGSWHDVQVQLHLAEEQANKGLRARTRAGYYAPLE